MKFLVGDATNPAATEKEIQLLLQNLWGLESQFSKCLIQSESAPDLTYLEDRLRRLQGVKGLAIP